jgi:hypothetical protein
MRSPRPRWRRRLTFTALGLLVALLACASALAASVQDGTLRISITTQLQPYKLPRVGTAPIAVFIAGHIASTDGTTPPQLQKMDVKINRHGRLDFEGLPSCRLDQLQPGTNERALKLCGDALVGSGHFWASVVFSEARPYHTTGRLLVFNGIRAGKPVLFAHIFTTVPFPSSFVVTFAVHQIHDGPYGTELTASLPQSLGNWGFVDRIKMTLRRKYHYQGKLHSYVNAGCPAPKGFHAAVFPLALATFTFAANQQLSTTITRPCGVSE